MYSINYSYNIYCLISDIKIRLGSSTPGEKLNEIYGHKFVLATRNESWGKIDSDILGKVYLIAKRKIILFLNQGNKSTS